MTTYICTYEQLKQYGGVLLLVLLPRLLDCVTLLSEKNEKNEKNRKEPESRWRTREAAETVGIEFATVANYVGIEFVSAVVLALEKVCVCV